MPDEPPRTTTSGSLSAKFRFSLLEPRLDDPPSWIGYWGGEEQNLTSLVPWVAGIAAADRVEKPQKRGAPIVPLPVESPDVTSWGRTARGTCAGLAGGIT